MKKTIENIDVKNKKVLLRVDFNVPMDGKEITNDKRIVEALPTIKYLLSNNAGVIACSHLGRPEGSNANLSLKPIAVRLSKLLGKKVIMAKDVAGTDAKAKAKALKPGQIMLLENLRFEKGEETNDEKFAKKLAGLADIYVNDAFGTAHREHASTYGVAKILPNAVGFLMSKEINIIEETLKNPERPFIAILGGNKVSDKIDVINNFLNIVDTIIIGGAMAYTFVKALGGSVGTSKVEADKLDLATKLMAKAKEKGVNFILPLDNKCGYEFSPNTKSKNVKSFEIPDNMMGLDIGRKTIKMFKKSIKNAKTIIWNGPIGVFEFPKFEKGTKQIAKAVSATSARSIIGGGDSASAVIKFGYEHKVTHVSTGGGASLKLMEGKQLPGVTVIDDAETKTVKTKKPAVKKAPAKKIVVKKTSLVAKKEKQIKTPAKVKAVKKP